MPKQGSGGWSKRTRKGNTTTTFNSKKGMTYTTSQKVGLSRITNTILPGGKARRMITSRTPDGYVRRETYTYGKKGRRKKATALGAWFALVYVVLFALVIILDK